MSLETNIPWITRPAITESLSVFENGSDSHQNSRLLSPVMCLTLVAGMVDIAVGISCLDFRIIE